VQKSVVFAADDQHKMMAGTAKTPFSLCIARNMKGRKQAFAISPSIFCLD
jgi:hypothetical protein